MKKTSTTPATPATPATKEYRADIEGMRKFAIGNLDQHIKRAQEGREEFFMAAAKDANALLSRMEWADDMVKDNAVALRCEEILADLAYKQEDGEYPTMERVFTHHIDRLEYELTGDFFNNHSSSDFRNAVDAAKRSGLGLFYKEIKEELTYIKRYTAKLEEQEWIDAKVAADQDPSQVDKEIDRLMGLRLEQLS